MRTAESFAIAADCVTFRRANTAVSVELNNRADEKMSAKEK
jgi:hypothetical protein